MGIIMNRNKQQGAQIVEFALVLPFILIFILMALDCGFLVYNKAIITNAAREAARAGSVFSATPIDPAAVACKYAQNLIMLNSGTNQCSAVTVPGTGQVKVEVTTSSIFGQPVTVKMTYKYKGFLNSAISMPVWTMISSATMNHE